jgi:hypothetical protein
MVAYNTMAAHQLLEITRYRHSSILMQAARTHITQAALQPVTPGLFATAATKPAPIKCAHAQHTSALRVESCNMGNTHPSKD